MQPVKSLYRLVLAGSLLVVALSGDPTAGQLTACDCSSNADCVNMHGGDRNWQCIIGPGTVCSQNGTLTGLCKYKSGGGGCVPDPNAICPLIYAPVTCSNGITYSNQCFANADCATGCEPGEG